MALSKAKVMRCFKLSRVGRTKFSSCINEASKNKRRRKSHRKSRRSRRSRR